MTQEMKSSVQGQGMGFDPFSFAKPGAALPGMSGLLSMQQTMAARAMEVFQQAMATMQSDVALASEVMRKLVLVKTPEEFAAWQRDMFELVGSKVFDQWTKFGEQLQGSLAKVAAPAAGKVETGGAGSLKKAA